MIADIWSDRRQRPMDALVRNPRIVATVERMTLNRLDHTITVVEESRNRLLALGVPAEKTSVVSNTPPLERIAALTPRAAEDPLRIAYLGLMEHHRGIASLLQAAHLLSEARVSFQLDLVGDGRDLELFRAQAGQLGLGVTNVVFHGRLPHGEAIKVVGQAHVGVVPHHATKSWNTTIPNKLFDYMAAGLAVVSSDAAPAARVVTEAGAGLVFRSGDGRQLAGLLRRLLDIPTWDQYRRAGQEAIRSRYNWEADTRTLLDVVASVGAQHASRDTRALTTDSITHSHQGRNRS
jgi:glycosyltransferase involved in cell wall biosynthesis